GGFAEVVGREVVDDRVVFLIGRFRAALDHVVHDARPAVARQAHGGGAVCRMTDAADLDDDVLAGSIGHSLATLADGLRGRGILTGDGGHTHAQYEDTGKNQSTHEDHFTKS